MQDRMQGQSRFADLIYQGVFSSLFPLFLWASRHYDASWGRDRAYEIAESIVHGWLKLRPKYLEAVCENVACILGKHPRHPEVQQLALRVAINHACAWVDFFYFGQRDSQAALNHFGGLSGEEHLFELLERGEGAILLTAHAGNFELGGVLLRALGRSIYTVYKPDRFEAVERLRDKVRRMGGVIGIPVGGTGFSTLPLVGYLREGQLVGMQGDRDFSLNGLPIPFFGREAFFPRGPWELAAMTGCPILICYVLSDGKRKFWAHFSKPIYISGDRKTRRKEIEAGMRFYAADLEDKIRRYPDQWCCFYPFWNDPLRQTKVQS